MTSVLLVEDEPGLADSLKTELEFSDMQVILASDGKQALDCFAQYQTQIDLIILDWMLPKIDQFPDGTLQNIGTGRNLFHPSAPYPASRLAESI